MLNLVLPASEEASSNTVFFHDGMCATALFASSKWVPVLASSQAAFERHVGPGLVKATGVGSHKEALGGPQKA